MSALSRVSRPLAAVLAALALLPATASASPPRGEHVAQASSTSTRSHPAKPTIVLVHGANADGSSWQGVIARLQARGYPVIAFANPLRSVAGDAAVLEGLMDSITGPMVLVGHSYGGMVISVAADENRHVKSLVFVDAQVPLPGETAAELTNKYPGSQFGAALVERPFTMPDGSTDTDLYVDPPKYRSLFTGFDVSARDALTYAAVQRPVTASALNEPASAAAWQHIPSWDVVGTKDKAIPPASQLFMARRARAHITRIPAPHASMLTFPGPIARVIRNAAR